LTLHDNHTAQVLHLSIWKYGVPERSSRGCGVRYDGPPFDIFWFPTVTMHRNIATLSELVRDCASGRASICMRYVYTVVCGPWGTGVEERYCREKRRETKTNPCCHGPLREPHSPVVELPHSVLLDGEIVRVRRTENEVQSTPDVGASSLGSRVHIDGSCIVPLSGPRQPSGTSHVLHKYGGR
jgi:hypothetical protein